MPDQLPDQLPEPLIEPDRPPRAQTGARALVALAALTGLVAMGCALVALDDRTVTPTWWPALVTAGVAVLALGVSAAVVVSIGRSWRCEWCRVRLLWWQRWRGRCASCAPHYGSCGIYLQSGSPPHGRGTRRDAPRSAARRHPWR